MCLFILFTASYAALKIIGGLWRRLAMAKVGYVELIEAMGAGNGIFEVGLIGNCIVGIYGLKVYT